MSVYESIVKGLTEAIEHEKGNAKAETIIMSDTPIQKIEHY